MRRILGTLLAFTLFVLIGLFSEISIAGKNEVHAGIRDNKISPRIVNMENGGRSSGAQNILKSSPYIFDSNYIPREILSRGQDGHVSCTPEGVLNAKGNGAQCYGHLDAQGNQWYVRYGGSRRYRVDSVFKTINGNVTPWVRFDPNNGNIVYASPGARQYAMSNGGGAPVVAISAPTQGPDCEGERSPTALKACEESRGISQHRATGTVARNDCASLSGNAKTICQKAAESGNAIGAAPKSLPFSLPR